MKGRGTRAGDLRAVFVLLGAGWSLFFGLAFVAQYLSYRAYAKDHAKVEARSVIQKDILFRRWASLQGGVYVPVTPQLAPNPFLVVPERDITTSQGRALTLVNPAYMTRLVHELGNEANGLQAHLTSLRPLRPQNAPTPWEAAALREMEGGAPEVLAFVRVGAIEYCRLMQPFITEESCLKCHGNQGYKVGDVRGGLSISVPLAPFFQESRKSYSLMAGILLATWGLGLASLFPVSRTFRANATACREAETLLLQANEGLSRDVAAERETLHLMEAGAEGRRKDIARLVQELAEAQSLLVDREKVSALGLLVEGMAHELNTPLGAVLSSAGSIRGFLDRLLVGPGGARFDLPEEEGRLLQAFLSQYQETFAVEAPERFSPKAGSRYEDLLALGGIAEPRRKAAILDDLSVSFDLAPYAPLLRSEIAFRLASDVCAILQCVAVIEDGAGKAAREVAGLKVHAAGAASESPVEVSVADLVDDAFEPFASQLRLLTVRRDLAPGLRVRCRREGLTRALANIVQNAVEATSGSGCLEATASLEGASLRLVIANDGPPIPEDLLPRLFKPFVTTKKRRAGKGLGLFIAQRVVEREGGTIACSSRPGRTEFIITLPIVEESHGPD